MNQARTRSGTIAVPALAAAIILALAVMAWAAPCRADRLAEIRQRGFVNVGVHQDLEPFGFTAPGGSPAGFEPELAALVAKRLDLDIKLIPLAPSRRISALLSGRVDMVAATLAHEFSREQDIDFSLAYFMDSQRFLARKDSGLKTISQLKGKRVAVMRGSDDERRLYNAQPRCKSRGMGSYAMAFVALKRDKVDAVSADHTILLLLKNSDPSPSSWAIFGKPVAREAYALGLPENESDFRDEINRALAALWVSGDFKALYSKWFGPNKRFHVPLDWELEAWAR